jgi:predicted nucleotidyltransferase component of viral defense system
MIIKQEVMKIARELKVDPNTIEQDYAISWFLSGIYADDVLSKAFVFKGGTALRKAYFPNYRFSEDLDFTVREEHKFLDERGLGLRLKNVTNTVRETSGISFELISLEKTREIFGEEAYEGKVEYAGPMGKRAGSLPRIKLDITFYENIIFPTNSRSLIHHYSDSDICVRNIEVYSIEEVLAEKLRSILQRTRPRDVYDLWRLLSQDEYSFDSQKIVKGFHDKCEHKGVTFHGVSDFFETGRLDSHMSAWGSTLGHQLEDVPDFQAVIKDLKIAISKIFDTHNHE